MTADHEMAVLKEGQGQGAEDITVTLTYAEPHDHWSRSVIVATGATVGDVLLVSGFRQAHPGWDISPAGVGIDGKQVELTVPVAQGDRVEVYRPLSFDPMVSRRRRAAHKARRAAAQSLAQSRQR